MQAARNVGFIEVSKGAKIRNRYNQVPHMTHITNEKVTNSVRHHNESQEVSPFPAGDHKGNYTENVNMYIYDELWYSYRIT